MCRPKSPEDRRLSEGTHGPYTGQNNDTLVISHVATQLAQIGDKLELTYQKNCQKESDIFSMKAVCVMALFVALRLAL